MQDFWAEELTEEETEALIERAAASIERRGLKTPAILFFEMHKPLAFIGSQTTLAFSPFLVPFLGFDGVNDYTRLFSKRENIERLLERLDRNDASRREALEG
jgi:hypothetical protein